MGQVLTDMLNSPTCLYPTKVLTLHTEVSRSGVKTRAARKRSAKLNDEYVYATNSAPKLEEDEEYGTENFFRTNRPLVEDDKRKKRKVKKEKAHKKKKKSKKDSKKKKRRRVTVSPF
jgi:hypothetical protein